MSAALFSLSDLHDALEATWLPARLEEPGDGLVFRDDAPAAGSRVCSARLRQAPKDPVAAAQKVETYYRERGGAALFQSVRSDAALADGPADPMEAALASRGFEPFDPCALSIAECAPVAEAALRSAAEVGVHAVEILTPLAILERFWAEGGIGAERQAVMRRVLQNGSPGGVLAARIDSRFQGAAFWAAAPGGVAYIHALHVAPEARRKKGALALLGLAAQRAAESGAQVICASTRTGNAPARALFKRCGFEDAGGYLYWRKSA